MSPTHGVRLGLLAAPALVLTLSGAMASMAVAEGRADCANLKGAAASFVDQSSFCQNMKQQFGKGKADVGTALKQSIKGAPRKSQEAIKKAAQPTRKVGRQVLKGASGSPDKHQKIPMLSEAQRRSRNLPPIQPWKVGPVPPPLSLRAPTAQAAAPSAAAPAPPRSTAPSTANSMVRPTPASSPAIRDRGAAQSARTETEAIRLNSATSQLPGGIPTVVAIALLLAGFAAHRFLAWPVLAAGPQIRRRRIHTAARRPRAHPTPSTGSEDPTGEEKVRPAEVSISASTAAWRLGSHQGMGATGPGANGFMRTAFVELLADDQAHTRIVVSRNELNRLFEGGFDEPLRQALSPRLHVVELLEDAIEHLDLEVEMAEAEQANPDLGRSGTGNDTTTYWFATPGMDADVVLQTIERWRPHNLVGLMFGPWPYGRTCAFNSDGEVAEAHDGDGGQLSIQILTPQRALATLRAHASATNGDRS